MCQMSVPANFLYLIVNKVSVDAAVGRVACVCLLCSDSSEIEFLSAVIPLDSVSCCGRCSFTSRLSARRRCRSRLRDKRPHVKGPHAKRPQWVRQNPPDLASATKGRRDKRPQ